VKHTEELDEVKIIAQLSVAFYIERVEGTCYKPVQKHHFGMRFYKKWYHLTLKEEHLSGMTLKAQLDVTLLQNLVLAPLFGIQNPRTDDRIDFVGGIRGVEELNKRTDKERCVAFSLYPTELEELIAIAKSDDVMPPKSTWFEPKLLSGLLIHCI
ncbi:MAG: DUF1015 domain-containing protein, partial [Cellulosilyticaceae bacterium]